MRNYSSCQLQSTLSFSDGPTCQVENKNISEALADAIQVTAEVISSQSVAKNKGQGNLISIGEADCIFIELLDETVEQDQHVKRSNFDKTENGFDENDGTALEVDGCER